MATVFPKQLDPVRRTLFLSGGLVCVTLGMIGTVVPGWPTTVFMILALYCFKRSSARLESWLLNHKLLGPTLRDWDENKWISLRVKWISCLCIIVFSVFACFLVSNPSLARTWTVRSFILAGAAAGIAYILTRRTKPGTVLAVACIEDVQEAEAIA